MQINARDYIFEASEDPTIVTPVWAKIGGLESFDLNPSENEESADTTVFDSNGQAESQAMQRGASLSLEGKRVRNGTTPDAGQAATEALAAKVGDDSLGGIRFRHKDDTEWVVWTAWVSLANQGGGNNDKTSWGATFTRSGAATEVAVTP
ncbi:phage tail tube protein [Nocardioides sp. R1-1]|uniref:phage tail tube protein n=1 Tax=Nocardioides sp. R1-1 TaxID=3383502 RepID=UPI0038D14FF3